MVLFDYKPGRDKNAPSDCKSQALRVLKKISTLWVVFFSKTLTADLRPSFQELSLFFPFFLFSFEKIYAKWSEAEFANTIENE